jgi:hypothetical protein
MPDLKQHGTAAAVAAMVAAGMQTAMPAKTVIEKPMHVTVAASKHAWPDLSDAQKAALSGRVGWLAGTKIMIFCDGSDCRDLQTDLDDAFEDARISSDRATPMNPIGYGMAVLYQSGDDARATRLAGDIKTASGDRVAPDVKANTVLAEGLVIVIGKRPR